MELGGGIFYGYVVVDIPLLVSNLTGCEREEWAHQEFEDARSLLGLLIQAVAQVTPGAKLGATAPYARAECVLLEVGSKQPRSLANAFLDPINNQAGGSKDVYKRQVQGTSLQIQQIWIGGDMMNLLTDSCLLYTSNLPGRSVNVIFPSPPQKYSPPSCRGRMNSYSTIALIALPAQRFFDRRRRT